MTPAPRCAILDPVNTQTRPQRPATYQEVLEAPPHMIAEIAGGHLHPRPAPRHASASFGMAGQLDGPLRRGSGGPGGWHLIIEPELHLGPDVLVPDLAAWRRERMPVFPNTPPPISPPTGSPRSSRPESAAST